MELDLRTLAISQKNIVELDTFIKGLDDEQKSFRYFRNRGFEVLESHVFTFLLLQRNIPVGYGHLDKEGDIVWLGLVVKQEFQGKGLAKRIMQLLIDRARELRLENIHLSVDNDNEKAIALYKRFGFTRITKNENNSILRKKLSEPTKKT